MMTVMRTVEIIVDYALRIIGPILVSCQSASSFLCDFSSFVDMCGDNSHLRCGICFFHYSKSRHVITAHYTHSVVNPTATSSLSQVIYFVASPWSFMFAFHSFNVIWLAFNILFNYYSCVLIKPGYAPTEAEVLILQHAYGV